MGNAREIMKRYRLTNRRKDSWLRLVTKNRQLHQQLATARGRLDWLLGFADRRHGPLAEDRNRHELACVIGLFTLLTGGSSSLAAATYYRVAAERKVVIQKLSIELDEGIAAFVDGIVDGKRAAWTIPVTCPMTRTLSRVVNQDHVAMLDWWDANAVDGWKTAFAIASANAVLAEAPNLRRCAGCKRVFVADDPRERFHSKPCATKTRVAQWRAKTTKRRRTKDKPVTL